LVSVVLTVALLSAFGSGSIAGTETGFDACGNGDGVAGIEMVGGACGNGSGVAGTGTGAEAFTTFTWA
jgi:hypothetical protein